MQPAHGYELKGSFDEAVGDQWGGLNIGHLYQLLDRLSRDGLIESERQPQTVKPDRVVHRLTPAGREELSRWLAAPSPRTRGYRDDFFLKVMAAAQIGDPEALRRVLSGQRAHLIRELRSVADARAELASGSSRPARPRSSNSCSPRPNCTPAPIWAWLTRRSMACARRCWKRCGRRAPASGPATASPDDDGAGDRTSASRRPRRCRWPAQGHQVRVEAPVLRCSPRAGGERVRLVDDQQRARRAGQFTQRLVVAGVGRMMPMLVMAGSASIAGHRPVRHG